MKEIELLTRFAHNFLDSKILADCYQSSEKAYNTLLSKKGAGSDYLGWIDLPTQIKKEDIQRIQSIAERIQKNSEYLVVIGIGGSYLGARAVIEALSNPFDQYKANKTKIIYAGHQLDPDYHNSILDFLKDKDFSVNVISKSGTTTEPAVAFRLLIDLLEKKIW